MRCGYCGSPLTIDSEKKIAKCEGCGAKAEIASQSQSAAPDPVKELQDIRASLNESRAELVQESSEVERALKVGTGMLLTAIGVYVLMNTTTVAGALGLVEGIGSPEAMPWIHYTFRVCGGMMAIGGLMSMITGFTMI